MFVRNSTTLNVKRGQARQTEEAFKAPGPLWKSVSAERSLNFKAQHAKQSRKYWNPARKRGERLLRLQEGHEEKSPTVQVLRHTLRRENQHTCYTTTDYNYRLRGTGGNTTANEQPGTGNNRLTRKCERAEGRVHPKITNSSACHYKLIWLAFFCGTQKDIF